ncbi:hypothetical protein ACYOEI_15890 [Singulisphaera rosea]
MVINGQELQGEWPKLLGYVKETWGQPAGNLLEIQGHEDVAPDDEIRRPASESQDSIVRIASDMMTRSPWTVQETHHASVVAVAETLDHSQA